MGYELEQDKITFTYRIDEGIAERSFANQVAKQVGICPETLELAHIKSMEMIEEEKMIKENKYSKFKEVQQFINE